MKKILMIVMNDFVNEARVTKEANTLGNNGYEVKVLSLYSSGLPEFESYKGFELIRIKLESRERLSKTNRYLQLLKYFEFYNKCKSFALQFNPDIVYVHDVFPLPIGMRVKKKLKCKLVYDSHELWSNVNGREDNPKFVNYLRDTYEKVSIKKADKIITVSDSIARHMEKIFKLSDGVAVIRNVPFLRTSNEKSELLRIAFGLSRNDKIVIYQGYIAKGRGIEEIIKSMIGLRDSIKLIIMGKGGSHAESIKDMIVKMNLQHRVFFQTEVPYTELLDWTSSADLGISLIQNVSLSDYYSLPNKMFEYIQAGIPVICSDFPDMKSLVEHYGVGEVSDPNNYVELRVKITSIFEDDDKNEQYRQSSLKAKSTLCWENEEKKLLSIVKEL